jgi:phospholipase/carboxylesterase
MEPSSLISQVAPINTTGTGPHPALVLLHGRGTDENDLLGLTSFLDPRFIIASVRAPYPFLYGGYTWFNLDEDGTVNIDQLLRSRDLFFQWLDDFQKTYPIDTNRLFLFGFSMGAMMSLVVSLSSPKRFKGVIAHSGLLPNHHLLSYRWDDLGALSFYIAHGEQDPVVPVAMGRQAHQRLVQAHANVQYHEYPIQHTMSDESLSDISAWLQHQISST